MMRAFGEVIGKRPRILRVPVLSPRLSSYWLGLVTSVPSSIARALVGGLKHDIPARDAELRQLVPQRLLTFREAVQAALESERSHRVPGRWTEGAFPHRAYRHDHAFYAKRAGGAAVTSATPARVWAVVTAIGGTNRYYALNFLWWLREFADWLVGGPGFTHGRRAPAELRIGDAIDYWTVLSLEPERRLATHVQAQLGELVANAGIMEALIHAGAQSAATGQHHALYQQSLAGALMILMPQFQLRAVQTVKELSGSGLIMTPTEKDFANPEIAGYLDQYLQGAGVSAKQRVQLFKLAWDLTGDQFGSRQALYEYFYAGDPYVNRARFYRSPVLQQYKAFVMDLLEGKKGKV